MLSLGTFALVYISLFMIHEFEEIALARPYIQRHKGDARFANEMFIAGGDRAYPSTETIALMIAEEFVLSLVIMLIGLAVGSVEIILAPFIAFTLHLIPHALEVLRFPGWAPGSRTAVALLAPSLLLILATAIIHPVNLGWLALCSLLTVVVMVVNLKFLYAWAGRIEEGRKHNAV